MPYIASNCKHIFDTFGRNFIPVIRSYITVIPASKIATSQPMREMADTLLNRTHRRRSQTTARYIGRRVVHDVHAAFADL